MKQRRKHIIYFLISAVMMMGILCACGKSPEKKIEGYWVYEHPDRGLILFNFTGDSEWTIVTDEEDENDENKPVYYRGEIKDYTYSGYGSGCEWDLDGMSYRLDEDGTKLIMGLDSPYLEEKEIFTYDIAYEKDKIQITGESYSILEDILTYAGEEITGGSTSVILNRIDEEEYKYITSLREVLFGTYSYLYGYSSAKEIAEFYQSDFLTVATYDDNRVTNEVNTILGEMKSEIVDDEVIEENLYYLEECWYDWIDKMSDSK